MAGLKQNKDAFKSLGVAPLKLNTLVGSQDANLTLPLAWCMVEGAEIAISVTSYDQGISDGDSDANSVNSGAKSGSINGTGSYNGSAAAGAGGRYGGQNGYGAPPAPAAAPGYPGAKNRWVRNADPPQDDPDSSVEVDPRLLGAGAPALMQNASSRPGGASASGPKLGGGGGRGRYRSEEEGPAKYDDWRSGATTTGSTGVPNRFEKSLSTQARAALQASDSDYGRDAGTGTGAGSSSAARFGGKSYTKPQANESEEEEEEEEDVVAGNTNPWSSNTNPWSRQRHNSAGSKNVGFRDEFADGNDVEEEENFGGSSRWPKGNGSISGGVGRPDDSAMAQELEELRTEVARLQEENNLLKNRDDDEDVAAAKAEYFEGEAKQLQEMLDMMTRERDQAVQEKQRMEQELKQKTEELEGLRQEAQQAKAEVAELNEQLDDAADSVAAATAKAQQYASKLTALEVELAEAQMALSAVQQRQPVASALPLPPSARTNPLASVPNRNNTAVGGAPTAASNAASTVRVGAEKSIAARPNVQAQSPNLPNSPSSPLSPSSVTSGIQERNPLLLGDDDLVHPSTTSGKQSAFSKRVYAFYMHYNPSKTSEVPALLEKFKGKEEELMQRLVRKYGKEPQVKKPEGDVLTLERQANRR